MYVYFHVLNMLFTRKLDISETKINRSNSTSEMEATLQITHKLQFVPKFCTFRLRRQDYVKSIIRHIFIHIQHCQSRNSFIIHNKASEQATQK